VAGGTFSDGTDALVYLPRGCVETHGVDVAGLRKEALIAANLETLAVTTAGKDACNFGGIPAAVKKLTGKDFQDWCDYVVWGHLHKVRGPRVAVLKSNTPLRVADLAKELLASPGKQLAGKTYYPIHQGEFTVLVMPTDRHIVLVGRMLGPELTDAQLTPLLTARGAPAILTGGFREAFARTRRSHFWRIKDEAPTLEEFRAALANPRFGRFPPAYKALLEAILRARPTHSSYCITVGTEEVSAVDSTICKDEASADDLLRAFERLVGTMNDEQLQRMAEIPHGPNPNTGDGLRNMARDMKKSLQFWTEKNWVITDYRVRRRDYEATMARK
jgi:hypothetical protein